MCLQYLFFHSENTPPHTLRVQCRLRLNKGRLEFCPEEETSKVDVQCEECNDGDTPRVMVLTHKNHILDKYKSIIKWIRSIDHDADPWEGKKGLELPSSEPEDEAEQQLLEELQASRSVGTEELRVSKEQSDDSTTAYHGPGKRRTRIEVSEPPTSKGKGRGYIKE